ncbi:polysaccharide pyruvyl transferase family protein [Prevotella sp.]
MRVLYILAPNDRFNYGDLLFPYIVQYYFKDCVDKIIFCSTSKSDLTRIGGVATENFRSLFKAKKADDNFLIVAGGDSLFIDWQTILSFVDPYAKYFYIADNILGRLFFSTFYKKVKYHATTLYPFSIGKDELCNFKKVFYNSLGGSILEQKKDSLCKQKVTNILKTVDYISIRDKATHDLLKLYGIQNVMVPDSAILMSDVFSENFLFSNISPVLKDLLNREYIFFQINAEHGNNKEKYYSDLLSSIAKECKLHICLCPIGLAPGHSDNIPLKNIHEKISDFSTFISDPTIWDIMYLIKHARIYVGTSLHGTITAMSFNTAFISHGPLKLKNYIMTWVNNGNEYFVDDYFKLEESIKKTLSRKFFLDSNFQKCSVIESINKIKQQM